MGKEREKKSKGERERARERERRPINVSENRKTSLFFLSLSQKNLGTEN